MNGKQIVVDSQIQTVKDLLHFYNFQNRIVIVEVNEHILQQSDHGQYHLNDSDKVEIVSFVGGG